MCFVTKKMPTRLSTFVGSVSLAVRLYLVESTPEHNFPDAARPLSRAALDALLRVKRELHELLSIALDLGAASRISFLGTPPRVRHNRSRRP